MPTEIQTPTAWAKLAEKFRLTGRHKLLLDEVVVPVVIVEDLASEVSDVGNDATGFVRVPPILATVGSAGLANLNNPGTNLLVDRIWVNSAATDDILITLSTIAAIAPMAGSLLVKTWNNPDQGGVPSGTLFADSSGFTAGSPGRIYRANLLSSHNWFYEPKLVLANGRTLTVTDQRANQQFTVTFQYRVVSTTRQR